MFSSNFFIYSPGGKKICRWLSCTDLHIHWILHTANKPVKLLRGMIFHKRVQNFAEHWTLLVTHFSVVVSIIFSKQIHILLVVSKFPLQRWYYDCVLIYWVTRSLLFLLVSLVLVNLLPLSLMNWCFSFHGLMGYIFILINSGNVLSLKSDRLYC